MEAEHLEVKDLPEPHVEGQKEQLVLPTQKTKEPFSCTEIKLQGVERIDHRTENVAKRMRKSMWQYPIFSCLDAHHTSTNANTTTFAANKPNPGLSHISSEIGMVGTSERTHAPPSGTTTSCPISATTTTLVGTSTPNSDSTPVSIGIRMVDSSGRTQSPCSDGGTGAASHTYSRPSLPASGGFLADERLGGEEAPAVAMEDLGPCQETIALIKTRSEMDAAFCTAILKCPLWEVVSRKLAEQGYTISPKKCKEKFENIQKFYSTGRKIKLNIKDGKSCHFFSQLDAPQIPNGAITTSLAAASIPKSAPTPVSTRTRMVDSSGRIQAFMSDPGIPTATSTEATAHIKVSQISPIVSGRSPTSIPGSADANKDLKVIELNRTSPFRPTVEEHRNIYLCLEKSNPLISTDTEHETVNMDQTNDQIDRTQSLSSFVEEPQTLSKCMENNGDNQLLSDEAITSKNKSIESLKHLQSSNKFRNSFSLESEGNERALQSSFDVTTIANSYLLREDERSLLMDRCLPFIKTFHLWESIRSMEVFQLMPQHPHFRPLEKENEELREGIAIGHMLSFAKLMDNACKAQLGDPRSKFENKLKALTYLEELGFTVQLIRSRLEALLSINDSYNQLDDESKAAEAEIIDKKRQVDEIQESMSQLNMQLQELLMEKERKSFHVDELGRMVDGINEKLQRAKLDFDNLVAASW